MPEEILPSDRLARRDVLKVAAVGTAGFWVAGRGAWAADAKDGPDAAQAADAGEQKVKLGIIGVGGRAQQNLDEEKNAIASQEIVAICDTDSKRLEIAAQRFPKAAKYSDFRKLLERNDLDGVVVSTADHTHAPATLIALSTGKHVYCEKPLAHTVEEARRVAETAKKYKKVTQMGTQVHNFPSGNYSRVVEMIQAGAIGAVTEVQVVFGAAKWNAGDAPKGEEKVPDYINYDAWVGPQPMIPYSKSYIPENWRSYWHWGTGTLGDMGCHYIDLPFWALKLRHPTKVKAEGPPVNKDGAPEWLSVAWDFPARGELPPVTLKWYHGKKKQDEWYEWGVPQVKRSGVVFIGEKGKLFADYDTNKFLPADKFGDYKAPPVSIPKSIGHHREWLAAIRKNDPSATTCNFDYSGAVAETVLLGTVAYRSGKALDWDGDKLVATNCPEAEQYIRQAEYRKGWGMDVLRTL